VAKNNYWSGKSGRMINTMLAIKHYEITFSETIINNNVEQGNRYENVVFLLIMDTFTNLFLFEKSLIILIPFTFKS